MAFSLFINSLRGVAAGAKTGFQVLSRGFSGFVVRVSCAFGAVLFGGFVVEVLFAGVLFGGFCLWGFVHGVLRGV